MSDDAQTVVTEEAAHVEPPVETPVTDPGPPPMEPEIPQPQQPTEPTPPEPQPEPQAESTTAPEEPPTEAEPTVERVVPKPSEYELPEGMPDQLRIFAHENDFTQEQLTATMNQFGQYLTGMQTQHQQALRQLGEAHLKNWGDQGQYRLSLAKRALQQNDPEGNLAKALNESGYGNHPAVLDFLYNLGKGMEEGGFLKSAVRRPPGKKTAAQSMYGDSHPSSEQ